MNVIKSNELQTLFDQVHQIMKSKLNIFNADYKSKGYHPHLTLAFRDLKKPMFKLAWAEFKERKYQQSFLTTGITLLKHNGKSWDENMFFPTHGKSLR